MVKRALLSALVGLLFFGATGKARADMSILCDRAAVEASQSTGVPLSVLKAIALTETGRRREGEMRPWPWTVNMEGQGAWFDAQQEALDFVHAHVRRGARSFDIGCFQINHRWHGEHFSSIEEMFDPRANALYAARFLGDLYAETGSWERAAGAYHSRTPEFANRYRARFETFRARYLAEDGLRHVLPDLPESPYVPRAPRPARVNTYPLFLAGGGGRMGSLVSVTDTGQGAAGALFAAHAGAKPLYNAGELP